jgi:hypothetical protein
MKGLCRCKATVIGFLYLVTYLYCKLKRVIVKWNLWKILKLVLWVVFGGFLWVEFMENFKILGVGCVWGFLWVESMENFKILGVGCVWGILFPPSQTRPPWDAIWVLTIPRGGC